MDILLKMIAGAVITVLLTATLRQWNRDVALLVSLTACIIFILPAAERFQIIFSYVEQLRDTVGLENSLFTPVLQVCGIGFLTQIAVHFCSDAGEHALGHALEICGTVVSLCAMLPLLETVFHLLLDFMRN